MTENKNSKLKNFFQKIKKFKGVEIAIVIVLISAMILIAISSFSTSKKEADSKTNTLEDYCANLEARLNQVLSKIEGVGEVSSMITLEGGFQQKLAYNEENSTTTGEKNGSTTQNTSSSQSVIYITQNGVETPLVLYEENPKIAGVVVVSSGAKDVKVKLDIIRAVSTLLNVQSSCIEVLVGK